MNKHIKQLFEKEGWEISELNFQCAHKIWELAEEKNNYKWKDLIENLSERELKEKLALI